MRLLISFLIALGVLNIMLLVSNGVLLSAYNRASERTTVEALADIAAQRLKLEAHELRAADRVSRLDEAIRRLSEQAARGTLAVATGPPPLPEVEDGVEDAAVLIPSGRPVPAEIPAMDPEELAFLLERRRELPRGLGLAPLMADANAVLADPLWNPEGRVLGEARRAELDELLADYRYFARDSLKERYELWVKPEVPRLREAGAFIEYRADEGPPHLEGVRVSHAEASDSPGVKRIYYFPPEDYPELAHHERVEQERGLETFLAIYEVINSP